MTDVDNQQYVAYQYSDSEKYLIRVETHRDHSEAAGNFNAWLLDQLEPVADVPVLDVGCGPGIYHRFLVPRGVPVVATDLFAGMLRDARARGGGKAALVQGTAEVLPFRDATFERVMANHMLYHVEDQMAALREMRRVARTGARVVLATNAADNMRRLHDLHTEACTRIGLRSTSDTAPVRFTLDHLELVRSVFPTARVESRDDALVFREAAPALRYYATFIVDYVDPLPPDRSHQPMLMESMRRVVDEVIEREGVLRVPKAAGCFIADL